MKERFILPEKWYIEGDSHRKDAREAWNSLNVDKGESDNYAFYKGCFYFLDLTGNKEYTTGKLPDDYIEITLDDFLEYVVGIAPNVEVKEDPELNEILIKLLTR